MSNIKSVEERKKEFLEASLESKNKEIASSNTLYDSQKTATTELYKGQIADTEKAYEDQYRENAVQKLINERQVAENMANMGLTDSGLNRTQQTAVQLSYANNKGSIDRQKQSQVDALAREMNSQLASIEQSRLSANAGIESAYEQNAWDNAVKAYNTDVEAETTKYKAEQERLAKQYKSDNDYNLKMAELNAKNGDGMYYFRREETLNNGDTVMVFDINGKEVKLQKGINPYTRADNTKVYAKEAADKEIGFFKNNGYQPKGLVKEGGRFTWTGKYYYGTGKQQKIWEAPNGKKFIWRGDLNEYQEVEF